VHTMPFSINKWLGFVKQSPLLEFELSAFAVIPGEDQETNPGIYGKALAQWLAEQLRAAAVPAGDVIAEDFGWCIPVESIPQYLFVACASTGGTPDQWRVFAFSRQGQECGGLASLVRHRSALSRVSAKRSRTPRRNRMMPSQTFERAAPPPSRWSAFRPELPGLKLQIQAKSIIIVLILCSTPPHSSSFQPTPAKVRFSPHAWLDLAGMSLSRLE
jgi:hypothetical protein